MTQDSQTPRKKQTAAGRAKRKQRARKSEPVFVQPPPDRRDDTRKLTGVSFVAGSITGRLVNVSESGLGLESDKPLRVLKRGTFTLGIGRARPEFRGQVRWCRLTGTTVLDHGETVPVYRSGISLARR